MTDAVICSGLTKRYRETAALDNLSISVRQGERFALLGVNGAGKSTLVKILSGLIRPTEGSAAICGRDICSERQAAKSVVGVSPQETAVAENLTVEENLLFFCRIYGVKDGAARTARLIESFRMEEVKNRRAKKLSGGYQRRLSIALALVHRPEVIFLDEPTLGLDVLARRALWEQIRALENTTVVLTTHYMEEAEALADRVGILSCGKLMAVGTPQELTERTGARKFEDAFVALANGGTA